MNWARNAANVATDLVDMAQDVMGAARRFGFRRKANTHPVDSLEDTKVAMAALGISFLEQGGLPSKEQQATLQRALQQTYDMSEADAAEALILGRWLMSQCGGPDPAVARISRKLRKLAGLESLQPLMSVLQAVASKNQDGLQARQTDALGTIARSFKLG
jgi:hypothetical protein